MSNFLSHFSLAYIEKNSKYKKLSFPTLTMPGKNLNILILVQLLLGLDDTSFSRPSGL